MYDITELHLARESERQSGLELRAMVDNSLVGIVKIGRRRMLGVNHMMSRLFGYSEAELLGRSPSMLFTSEQAWTDFVELSVAMLSCGEVAQVQVEMLDKRAERLWIEVSGRPLADLKGQTIWVLADVTAQKRNQDRIDFLGHHDELTGLADRRLLDDRLAQALASARRSGLPMALCYLDLVGFKAVNDRYGHGAGNTLLVEVGHRLSQVLRLVDTASLVGGDEFVLLANLEGADSYLPIVDRVLTELARPYDIGVDREVFISASAGVALFPLHGGDARALMQLADAALYQAKAAGKHCMRLHGQPFVDTVGLDS